MKQEYDFSKGERGKFYRRNATVRLPVFGEKPDWSGPESPLGSFIIEEASRTLASYGDRPRRVTEHAESERITDHGGYAHRQLFELVQNSADALRQAPHGRSILVRLTDRFLYCADNGTPIDEDGIVGLMLSRMSSKRNTSAIGRFGLGFKSVLDVSDAPEFYSRPVSFRFDRASAAKRIAEIVAADNYPALRLPEPFDPDETRSKDEDLDEAMSWATNVVRLPLKAGARDDLAQQINDFPPEFLLFVDHVRYLTLMDGERTRSFMLHRRDDALHLDTDRGTARWRLFDTMHPLSAGARDDWPSRGDSNEAPIQWAAPLDRLDRPGRFWAFFPTKTASLVAGILNAPWKMNEDCQNLLPGPYNEELIGAVAEMIADALPELATPPGAARRLDAFPRWREAGDPERSVVLQERLYAGLRGREVVSNRDGTLRAVGDIAYPSGK